MGSESLLSLHCKYAIWYRLQNTYSYCSDWLYYSISMLIRGNAKRQIRPPRGAGAAARRAVSIRRNLTAAQKARRALTTFVALCREFFATCSPNSQISRPFSSRRAELFTVEGLAGTLEDPLLINGVTSKNTAMKDIITRDQ